MLYLPLVWVWLWVLYRGGLLFCHKIFSCQVGYLFYVSSICWVCILAMATLQHLWAPGGNSYIKWLYFVYDSDSMVLKYNGAEWIAARRTTQFSAIGFYFRRFFFFFCCCCFSFFFNSYSLLLLDNLIFLAICFCFTMICFHFKMEPRAVVTTTIKNGFKSNAIYFVDAAKTAHRSLVIVLRVIHVQCIQNVIIFYGCAVP